MGSGGFLPELRSGLFIKMVHRDLVDFSQSCVLVCLLRWFTGPHSNPGYHVGVCQMRQTLGIAQFCKAPCRRACLCGGDARQTLQRPGASDLREHPVGGMLSDGGQDFPIVPEDDRQTMRARTYLFRTPRGAWLE